METIKVKEIIKDLQEIQILTIRKWISDNKIPGKLPTRPKFFILFDKEIYLKWKKEDYPAIRDKYLRRAKHKYMYTRDQLKEMCKEVTGHIIPGKYIQRWVYKDLPVKASKRQVKSWFKSDSCERLIRFVIEEDHPINIKKIYSRPCEKDMRYKSHKRCIEYTECIDRKKCLDFFDAMGWHGWSEV